MAPRWLVVVAFSGSLGPGGAASGTAAGQAHDAGGAVTAVRGRAETVIATCCGGAAVQPGRVCSATAAYRGEVVVRRGARNVGRIVARTTTGPSGGFRLALPPGTYCLAAGERTRGVDTVAAPRPDAYTDAACLRTHQAQCDAVVAVPRAAPVTLQLTRSCFGPCYHGPMPP